MPEIVQLPPDMVFTSPEEERLYRKQRLAAGFRLFSKFGFDEGSPATSPPVTPSTSTTSGSTRSACTSATSGSPT